ncbi:MAG: T9SS type A sorting domain-containing protein [Ignavibacteriales bacterium]|nr:T9SS type A sorting domain-containing protein [Ignavibacteriales bacterium]
MSLGADNQYLFAGTSASSIWRRPLSQVVTDINDEIIAHPSEFSLGQNYPNPFNPITKIKWQSPESGHQTLKIYDVLGNEVATLVDEIKPAGSYEIDFNASQFSSGLYIYTLQAAKFTSTKKMILIK